MMTLVPSRTLYVDETFFLLRSAIHLCEIKEQYFCVHGVWKKESQILTLKITET